MFWKIFLFLEVNNVWLLRNIDWKTWSYLGRSNFYHLFLSKLALHSAQLTRLHCTETWFTIKIWVISLKYLIARRECFTYSNIISPLYIGNHWTSFIRAYLYCIIFFVEKDFHGRNNKWPLFNSVCVDNFTFLVVLCCGE